mgnify:CR=1 FL=1
MAEIGMAGAGGEHQHIVGQPPAVIEDDRAPGGIATLILPSDVSWNNGGIPGKPLPLPVTAKVSDDAVREAARTLRLGEPTVISSDPGSAPQFRAEAGIDVVCDGELYRFDVNHPETNGMIDYFIRPMSGIHTALARAELAKFRAAQGMKFRTQPAGVVRGELGEGNLNLPAAWQGVRGLTSRPLKFTLTSPYMLAKTLVNEFYPDTRALTMALAEVLRRQVADIDAAMSGNICRCTGYGRLVQAVQDVAAARAGRGGPRV